MAIITAGSVGSVETKIVGYRVILAESGRARLFRMYHQEWATFSRSPSGDAWVQLWRQLGGLPTVVAEFPLAPGRADYPFTADELKALRRRVVRTPEYSFEVAATEQAEDRAPRAARSLLESLLRKKFPGRTIPPFTLTLHGPNYSQLLVHAEPDLDLWLPVTMDDEPVDFSL